MRLLARCTKFQAILFALIGLLAARSARAALMEKPVLDGINNTIAVLRYLHRQVADLEDRLNLVRAARDLTQRQLDALKSVYEAEMAKGNKERAAAFRNRLVRLERQMGKLNEFDFEKDYSQRIAKVKEEIAKVNLDLDTRMMEFEALFGRKPSVEIAFEKEMEKYRPKRADAAYFLNLD